MPFVAKNVDGAAHLQILSLMEGRTARFWPRAKTPRVTAVLRRTGIRCGAASASGIGPTPNPKHSNEK
jgi:hypothetical protein